MSAASRDGIAGALVRAIAEGRVRPIYMALVDLATDRIVAVEALARWYRPSGEVVPPDDFIPVAEQSDLIIDLDLAVAGQAVADLAAWQRVDPSFCITVNLSGRHFAGTDSIDRLTALVTRDGVDPATVILELTETVRPQDLDVAADVVRRLRSVGFRIWLDDFGSGWSGMADLLHFPVDGIKIDRPFARRLGSPAADAVIGAVSGLGEQLGLTVTLEGIEERRQADRALALGCDLGQGFLWSHGLTSDEVDERLPASRPVGERRRL
ncbi:MAG TPA: EAL domain-containing protein [Microlunatus sp.]|nr:EAL domain-containing protein [Microlunatus sp.]